VTESQTPIRRVVLASFIGTTIEWYDYFIYGTAAALVFNKLFFPELDSFTGTIAAFGTFAVGFFARPIGGLVFGHYGDKLGRKNMLVTTLVLMGVATFLIGCLPTHASIGIAAPILLVVLRFIQGFGVGGEWGGAVLMAVEHGHKGRRGFFGSCAQAGVPIGLLLATGVFTLLNSQLTDAQFLAWGWRVPFLIGILLLGVGLYIRLAILESPLFTKLQKREPERPAPIREVLTKYPRNVLIAMGARFAENASFYIFTVFIYAYAKNHLQLDRQVILNAILVASAAQFIAVPCFGALSDRVGRRPVYIFGAVFTALFAMPFFLLVETQSPALITLAMVLAIAVGHAAMYGPQAAFFSELFGTRVRYSGVSLGYQLASPFAGGLAPIIAALLLKWSDGNPWPVAVYLVFTSLITLTAIRFAKETVNTDLSDGDN
jgi:MHS family shikimate/dehydroshikimate transporter-like MFS transporter